jgi:Right handed beta helix region
MTRSRTTIAALAAGLAGTLAFAAGAQAVTYPPPAKPKTIAKPKGPFKTRTVCKTGCDFTKIQAAVNASGPGDTIKVKAGTYPELVTIKGANKRYLKIIGDPKNPEKVLLDGSKTKAGSGITINGAAAVTLNGLAARGYKANGFFVVNTTGYTLTNLSAKFVGVYGVYAFNSVGGTITHSVAAWNNDSGFYIGQTPPQAKPIRSIVSDVTSYGNVLGFSGTNMRYVTITKSKWFNNGLGIVPNTLSSEKYAPPEDNVITDNDVFLNNWNYFAAAPFKLRAGATGEIDYPVGTGILLFGGRRTTVTKNRIYGNYLVGVAAIDQLLLRLDLASTDPKAIARLKGVDKDAPTLRGNKIENNVFGNTGKNVNGRDIFYDGSGFDNCVGPNTGVQVTTPASGSTLTACPFTGANAFSQDGQNEAVNWTVSDPTHEKFWVKNPQAAVKGVTPFEHWTKAIGTK